MILTAAAVFVTPLKNALPVPIWVVCTVSVPDVAVPAVIAVEQDANPIGNLAVPTRANKKTECETRSFLYSI
jgi:hypothetical protein